MTIRCPHCNNLIYVAVTVKQPEPELTYYHPNPEWEISKLRLSVRTTNCLLNEGYDTIGKVVDGLTNTPWKMRHSIPGIGPRCYSEIKQALGEYGHDVP